MKKIIGLLFFILFFLHIDNLLYSQEHKHNWIAVCNSDHETWSIDKNFFYCSTGNTVVTFVRIDCLSDCAENGIYKGKVRSYTREFWKFYIKRRQIVSEEFMWFFTDGTCSQLFERYNDFDVEPNTVSEELFNYVVSNNPCK